MKLITVIGARPQFIKAAAVSPSFHTHGVEERIIHTGQHYDANMSDLFFEELAIPTPTWSLGVGSGSHGAQTGAMLAAIEEVLDAERPDMLMVYGDTNSTLAGALAATKLHIPVAHVEAGLRSFNRRMPEEVNRVLTDHASDLLFPPTDAARAQLATEGINGEHVRVVGDVMLDLAMRLGRTLPDNGLLEQLGVSREGFVLATIHRAENTDDPTRLSVIADAVAKVSDELPVVLPLHPRTRSRIDLGRWGRRVHVIEPVGYLDMVRLERAASLVVTDSGGVQKEAFFHGRPCVTLRDETEWTELVDLGWNRLVTVTSADDVATAILAAVGSTGTAAAPYGRGDAGQQIAATIGQWNR